MKPICVPCQRFYKPIKTGTFFTEGMPIEGSPPPGLAAPEKWQPYKLWSGDKWECPGCGSQIISGTGRAPVAEHYESDFTEVAAKCGGDQLQINDC